MLMKVMMKKMMMTYKSYAQDEMQDEDEILMSLKNIIELPKYNEKN